MANQACILNQAAGAVVNSSEMCDRDDDHCEVYYPEAIKWFSVLRPGKLVCF